jgi:hypothetical protein
MVVAVMLTYSNWLTGTITPAQERTLREQERAADAWRRIGEKPQSITLRTAAGTDRAAQTVRLEVDNRASESSSAAGAAPKMHVIVYGIRNHATLANTAMAEGDRFNYAGDAYRIVDIILQTGEVQGVGEAIG